MGRGVGKGGVGGRGGVGKGSGQKAEVPNTEIGVPEKKVVSQLGASSSAELDER